MEKEKYYTKKYNRDKYKLCGSVKLIKDFIYIFRDMQFSALVNTETINKDMKDFWGIPWQGIDTLCLGEEPIIACLPPGEKRTLKIDSWKQKMPNKKIIPCENFFSKYDEKMKIPDDRYLYIWGAGRIAARILDSDKLLFTPTGIIDSYSEKKIFYNYPIIRSDDIEDWSKVFIIIAVADSWQIEELLKEKQLIEGEDYVFSSKILYNPVEMLKDVFFSEDGYNFACNTMLNHLEIGGSGATRLCCTAFVKADCMNFLRDDFEEHWAGRRSIMHRILALSTQNRSYVFCDHTMCPLFDGRKNIGASSLEIENAEYHDISPHPRVINLGFDKSCNLACESCRKHIMISNGKEKMLADKIAEKAVYQLLPHAEFIIMAGNGEVLLSHSYRRVWEDKAATHAKYFRILSNGLLFNSDIWAKFRYGKENSKILLTVSIDAASKKTYEEVRKYGDFEQLRKNMAFAGSLRRCGKLSYFRMNFVVQKKNMHEMKAFAAWGKEVGADKVFFTKITNWGTYEHNFFQEHISIMEKDGITPIKELQEILDSPEMQDPIVDLGTIRYTHIPNTDDYIENYYMWELEKDVKRLFEG